MYKNSKLLLALDIFIHHLFFVIQFTLFELYRDIHRLSTAFPQTYPQILWITFLGNSYYIFVEKPVDKLWVTFLWENVIETTFMWITYFMDFLSTELSTELIHIFS